MQMITYTTVFAKSQYGSDDLRMKAAQIAAREGAFEGGKARLWLKGEWRNVQMVPFEVTSEWEEVHSPEVGEMAADAIDAIYKDELQKAKEILNKALKLEPDSPDLLNNYAKVLEAEGQYDESLQLLLDIYDDYPDYFFGIVAVARLYIEDEDFEQAHQLMDPLMQKCKMHFSEFDSFCGTYIDLMLAENRKDEALSWFGLWQDILPESTRLENYEKLIKASK